MEADSKHVHAEPREARDDIAKDGHVHEPAFAHQTAPARVKDRSVPENNDERTVFLRVPTPEAAPGLIRPNPAKDSANKAEQGREADNAINHAGKSLGCALEECPSEDATEDIDDRKESSHK